MLQESNFCNVVNINAAVLNSLAGSDVPCGLGYPTMIHSVESPSHALHLDHRQIRADSEDGNTLEQCYCSIDRFCRGCAAYVSASISSAHGVGRIAVNH